VSIAADQWNARHPIGTKVRYFPVMGEPDFDEAETRSEAWTLGHGAAVVKITGRAGGVLLDHLEVADVHGAASQENMDAALAAITEAAKLRHEVSLLKKERGAIEYMLCRRLGGTVEGQPTAAINYLQRVDELREIERQNVAAQARIAELEADIQAIHDQTTDECYDALKKVGIDDEPDGGGQPDYLLPSIVGQTLCLLSEKLDEFRGREQRVISEEMASGRLLAERDAAQERADKLATQLRDAEQVSDTRAARNCERIAVLEATLREARRYVEYSVRMKFENVSTEDHNRVTLRAIDALVGPPAPARFYILALKHIRGGDSHATWWRPDSKGYCWSLTHAGLYDEAEARQIEQGSAHDGMRGNVAVPESVARDVAYMVVEISDSNLQKLGTSAKEWRNAGRL
jgi:hypothetical protein